MHRRDFLKTIGLAVAYACVPKLSTEEAKAYCERALAEGRLGCFVPREEVIRIVSNIAGSGPNSIGRLLKNAGYDQILSSHILVAPKFANAYGLQNSSTGEADLRDYVLISTKDIAAYVTRHGAASGEPDNTFVTLYELAEVQHPSGHWYLPKGEAFVIAPRVLAQSAEINFREINAIDIAKLHKQPTRPAQQMSPAEAITNIEKPNTEPSFAPTAAKSLDPTIGNITSRAASFVANLAPNNQKLESIIAGTLEAPKPNPLKIAQTTLQERVTVNTNAPRQK